MVKNLFVVLPFCIKDYEEKAQQLAHEAELKLDTYCELVSLDSLMSYYRENKELGLEEASPIMCLSRCLEYMTFSDVVVFTHDWKDFMESRVLHEIAEYYDLNVLELKVDALDILDTNDEEPQEEDLKLMPCPKCNKADRLEIVEDKQTHQIIVRCNRCGISVSVLNTMDSVDGEEL